MSGMMDKFIRQAAGRGAAAGTESGPLPELDLERAADLAERLGCGVREAIQLVGGAASAPAPDRPPVTPGNAGAGTGGRPSPPPVGMNERIRIAIFRQQTGYTGPVVLPGARQTEGR